MTNYFDPGAIRRLSEQLFEHEGLAAADAKIVVDGLIQANLRGIDSHGVSRIPMYLTRLRRKVVNPRPTIETQKISGAVSLVDGDNGMGFLSGRIAMNEACILAKDLGIGLVGVRRSTHYGMAALYVLQAAEAGMISMAFTNSSPALPVWGGRTTFLGAAPLAAGVPAGHHSPYVLDMAMTVIARGKIRLAAVQNKPIPEGLALDAEGRPTTDAAKAFEGVCLPFGGIKGSALAMLMDLLAGVLTGAKFGGDVNSLYFDHTEPQNVGHLFIALKPDLFMSREAYDERMDTFVDRVKKLPRAADVEEILIPGEPEERTAAIRAKTGLPITPQVEKTLRDEAGAAGLTFPQGSETPL